MPPEDVVGQIEVDPAPFHNAEGNRISRAAIVKLSDRVQVEWLEPVPQPMHGPATLSSVIPAPLPPASSLRRPNAEPFGREHGPATLSSVIPALPPVIVSRSARHYEKPHRSTGKMSWNIIDSSVHRVISDLSLLIGRQRGHRIIAAGDLTVWYGYGINEFWERRNSTVFSRMAAIGLPFVGPQHPNGRQADPWPSWLPKDSLNVPTFYNVGASPRRRPDSSTSYSHPKAWWNRCRYER